MNDFNEALKKYTALDKEYKNYLGQFFGTGWEGEEFYAPAKVLAKNEIEKLKSMKQKLDKAHNGWLNLLYSKAD